MNRISVKVHFCHLYSVPGTENRPVRQLVSWHVTVHNGLHNVIRALMATITAPSWPTAFLSFLEQDAQKDLHAKTGRDETKRKTQERRKRRSRKRSSSAGNEKMERVGDR